MILVVYGPCSFESTLRFSKTYACRRGEQCYRTRLVIWLMRGEVINTEDTELIVAGFGNDESYRCWSHRAAIADIDR
jgi:hypothetical protein